MTDPPLLPGRVTAQLAAQLQDALGPDYRLEQELKGGGMSRLFLATDLRHDRKVVVKVLSPELVSTESAKRFKREIELTVKLQHPHILPILTSGSWDDCLYYITPYIAGESLKARIEREGKLPLDDIVKILRDVSGALAFAHQRGIVHRDVKPANILLAEGHAILADFGIARAVATNSSRLTASGITVGTPAYMAPELPTDEKADVYALGIVGQEMMHGNLSRPDVTLKEILSLRGRVQDDTRTVTTGLAALLARAGSRSLADRPQSADEFRAALDDLRPGRRLPLVGAAVFALGVAATFVASFIRRDSAADWPRDRFAVATLSGTDSTSERVALLVRDQLAEWRGVSVVDDASRAGDRTLEGALRWAKDVRARNLAIVRAQPTDGRIDVRIALYDVTGDSVRKTIRGSLPARSFELADSLRVVTNAILRERADHPWQFGAPGSAPSIGAWRAYDSGRDALDRWELTEAENSLRTAIRTDPNLAPAHLWLAQTIAWADTLRGLEQRKEAQRALSLGVGMRRDDSLQADALNALAVNDFVRACELYRTRLARDSTDVVAWLGLGDCQMRDRLAVPSARTSTHLAFRTSYESAAKAYQEAEKHLRASADDAFPGWLLGRLANVLIPASNRVRLGYAVDGDTTYVGAFPYLDHDTIAFAPHPVADFATLRGDPAPDLIQRAAARNRTLLRGAAEEWVRRTPRNPAALDSLAGWAEVSGGVARIDGQETPTLEILRRARAVSRDTLQQARLAIGEIRELARQSRFAEVKAKADSLYDAGLLRGSRQGAAVGVAILLGKGSDAVRLLPLTQTIDQVRLANGETWTIPLAVRETIARLQVLSAFAVAGDSLQTLARRASDLIRSLVPDTAKASRIRSQLITRNLTLAGPKAIRAAEVPLPVPDEVSRAVLLAARGDTIGARRQVAMLNAVERGKLPGNGLPMEFRLAMTSLAVGDTAVAVARLDEILRTLPVLTRTFIEQPDHVAALVRAHALRALIAERNGDLAVARRYASVVVTLWEDADSSLQPFVDSMRALAAKP